MPETSPAPATTTASSLPLRPAMDGSLQASPTRTRPGAEIPIVRHTDFYFADGSIVIIVERTAFRVHQSILARHSEVFATLWDVPQPRKTDVYDGCPKVELHGDSLHDFVDVMKVLYDVL